MRHNNKLFPEQHHQRNKSPGPNKIESPCLLARANILRIRGRRARRWRETPRCAHGRTPGVGARRAQPSREAVEKASTKLGKRRRLESQPKFKTGSEPNALLLGVAKDCKYILPLSHKSGYLRAFNCPRMQTIPIIL